MENNGAQQRAARRENAQDGKRGTGMYPLLTRDPVSGDELIVTRLECPSSGITIEGQFSLGWIGRLTQEQLDFVELMVKYRGNIQKLASEMNIAYNTARNRLDDIVTALGGTPEYDGRPDRRSVLDKLAAKEITVEEAMKQLKG
ncbi:Fis family transcriptional regulator [Ktedonobacteria bacterium brp13]|jgi:hypothetical protein|nr:Fis family transcriptional regulator [Ktedonobacteria bacterium brp13]